MFFTKIFFLLLLRETTLEGTNITVVSSGVEFEEKVWNCPWLKPKVSEDGLYFSLYPIPDNVEVESVICIMLYYCIPTS